MVFEMLINFLKNNKKFLGSDGYIQFEKSVRNIDIPKPYVWIDGLQIDKQRGGIWVWLSTEQSEIINSIPLENIKENNTLLGDILKHLIDTIAVLDPIVPKNKKKVMERKITLENLEDLTPEELLNEFPYTKKNKKLIKALFGNTDNLDDEDFFEECYKIAKLQLEGNIS